MKVKAVVRPGFAEGFPDGFDTKKVYGVHELENNRLTIYVNEMDSKSYPSEYFNIYTERDFFTEQDTKDDLIKSKPDPVKAMLVSVRLKSQSQPMVFKAVNSYVKEGFFCVHLPKGVVKKFPIADIFDVTEDYNVS